MRVHLCVCRNVWERTPKRTPTYNFVSARLRHFILTSAKPHARARTHTHTISCRHNKSCQINNDWFQVVVLVPNMQRGHGDPDKACRFPVKRMPQAVCCTSFPSFRDIKHCELSESNIPNTHLTLLVSSKDGTNQAHLMLST